MNLPLMLLQGVFEALLAGGVIGAFCRLAMAAGVAYIVMLSRTEQHPRRAVKHALIMSVAATAAFHLLGYGISDLVQSSLGIIGGCALGALGFWFTVAALADRLLSLGYERSGELTQAITLYTLVLWLPIGGVLMLIAGVGRGTGVSGG